MGSKFEIGGTVSGAYRGGSVCLNRFGRFFQVDFRLDYAATIIDASASK
jgi:uncharacterized membrane protein